MRWDGLGREMRGATNLRTERASEGIYIPYSRESDAPEGSWDEGIYR